MEALLKALLPWGTGFLQTIEGWRSPVLTTAMKVITLLGNEEGYLLLLPLLYWCINAPLARTMFVLLFTSFTANTTFKHMFAIPRPGATGVTMVYQPGGFSFPSGHAQGTMTMWGYLVTQWKDRRFRIAAVVLIFLVGFSRLYLGVHYPQDVLGGWLVALLLVVAFVFLAGPVQRKLRTLPFLVQLAIAVAYPLALFFLMPVKDNATTCGVLLGFTVGTLLEQRWVGFTTEGSLKERALRYSAILVVLVVWVGSKKIFPGGIGFRLLRYACVGLVVTAVIPWGFVKLGWAGSTLGKENQSPESSES
jgi:membrane-associated phospholipid phosphatase